jgi:hypothetical protein
MTGASSVRIEGCYECLVLTKTRVGCSESLSVVQCGATIVVYKGETRSTQKQRLCWYDLPYYSRLQNLEIACTRSVIIVEDLLFENQACVRVVRKNNTVFFRHNKMNFLNLHCSASKNLIDFTEQEPLQEVDCSIKGSALYGLQVVGYNESRLHASGNSVAILNIPFSSHRRKFFFAPVGQSRFVVLTPDLPHGRFVESEEQWTMEAVLREISLNSEPTSPSIEAKSGMPICAVCRESLPTILLAPCKHLCICDKCIQYYQSTALRQCPICNGTVSHSERIFISCA